MEKYFNDDQIDYMNDLANHPDKTCKCGWYWKTECSKESPASWCNKHKEKLKL